MWRSSGLRRSGGPARMVDEQIPDPLLIEDPAEPVVRTGGRRVPVASWAALNVPGCWL